MPESPPQAQDPVLQAFHAECRRLVQARVDNVSSKFEVRHYVPRTDAQLCYQQFVTSPQKLFLVIGESGKGKTNLMSHLALASVKERPTVFTSGLRAWEPGRSLWELLFDSFQDRVRPAGTRLEAWLRDVFDRIEESRSSLFVFIDGINETDDPPRVLRGLQQALEGSPKCVRFLLSCRTDSFRLHFASGAFWQDHLFQRSGREESPPLDQKLYVQLLARATERFDRIFDQDGRKRLEEVLARDQDELRRKREELARNQAIQGSVLLDSFNEIELAQAERKYGVVATLVGKAREDCHDPLVFRFFAETLGRHDAEVAEVFLVQNCRDYLHQRILEVRARHPDLDPRDIYRFVFDLARRLAEKHAPFFGDSEPLDQSWSKEESRLLDSLVDSGLIVRQGLLPDGGSRSVAFTFDRIFSFILALGASRDGESGIEKRLKELADSGTLFGTDIHQCLYLILLLDEAYGPGRPAAAVRTWVKAFLQKPSIRENLVSILPDLTTWSVDDVLAEIQRLLLAVEVKRDYSIRFRKEDLEYFVRLAQWDDKTLISSCADALSTLARRGDLSRVIAFIAGFLDQFPEVEQREIFSAMVRPLAVAFPADPDRALILLERFCLSREGDPSIIDSSFPYTDESLDLVQNEIARFPTARLQLIQVLRCHRSAILRRAVAYALPALAMSDAELARHIGSSLAEDGDEAVRSSLPLVLSRLYACDEKMAVTLSMKLWEDRDPEVRSALAPVVLALFSEGVAVFEPLLKGLLVDEAVRVRAAFAEALGEALEREASPTRTAVLRSLLEVFAHDASDRVRAKTVETAYRALKKDPRWALSVIHTAIEEASPALKLKTMDLLRNLVGAEQPPGDRESLDWRSVSAEALAIARVVATDRTGKVRAASVDLLAHLAELEVAGSFDLLRELMADREVMVRLQILVRDLVRPLRSLSSVLRSLPPELPDSGWKRTRSSYSWLSLGIDAVQSHFDARSRLRWSVEILGAASVFLTTLLFLVPLEGWRASWLGDGGSAVDPRSSLLPVLLGAAIVFPSGQLIRFLTLQFHAHFLKRPGPVFWLAWAIPPLTASLVYSIARWLWGREWGATAGLAALVGLEWLASAVTDWWWRRARQELFGQGALFVLAAGVLSGFAAGWMAAVTVPAVFAPLCVVLCVAMLSLPLRPTLELVLATGTAIGIALGLVTLTPALVHRFFPWSENALYLLVDKVADPGGLLAAALGILVLGLIFGPAELATDAVLALSFLGLGLGALATVFSAVDWKSGLYGGILVAAVFLLLRIAAEDMEWAFLALLVAWLSYGIAGSHLPFWLTPITGLLIGLFAGLGTAFFELTTDPLAGRSPDAGQEPRLLWKRSAAFALFGAAALGPCVYGASQAFAALILHLPDAARIEPWAAWLPFLGAAFWGMLLANCVQTVRWTWPAAVLSLLAGIAVAACAVWWWRGDFVALVLTLVLSAILASAVNLWKQRRSREGICALIGYPLASVLLIAVAVWSGSSLAAYGVLFFTLLGTWRLSGFSDLKEFWW